MKYIYKYNMCQKSKMDKYRPYRKMVVSKTLTKVQKSIAMDWIIKLPPLKELIMNVIYDSILIIMD